MVCPSHSLPLLFTLLCVANFRVSTAALVNSVDASALFAFAKDAGGIADSDTWKLNADCKTWKRVQCDLTGRIIGVYFSGAISNYFGFELAFPRSIYKLTALVKLDLSNNFLSGRVPASLGFMQHLRYLNLSSIFSSGYPDSVEKLKKLTVLDLSNNYVGAPAPPGLGNLTELVILNLGGNGFTGPVPDSWASLTKLTRLDLHGNYFQTSVPLFFGKFVNLKYLDLSGASWSSGFPFSVAQSLVNLEYLDLSSFFGYEEIPKKHVLPVSLWSLTKLNYLDISWADYSASTFAPIGGLTNLRVLKASASSIPISYLSYFNKLQSLKELYIYNNGFEGVIPPDFGSGLPALEVIDLSYNGLIGKFPAAFLSMRKLRSLYFSSNNFTGSLPSELGGMSSLQLVDLSYNFYYGNIPVSYANLTRLTLLDLSHNLLSGDPAAYFSKLVLFPTSSISLYKNAFTGPLPTVLKYSTTPTDIENYRTAYVNLDGNFFYGSTYVMVGKDDVCSTNSSNLSVPQFNVRNNCLVGNSVCPSYKQRPSEQCRRFCFTNTSYEQCYGHGTCVSAIVKSKFTGFQCECDKGYVTNPKRKGECVKNASSKKGKLLL